MPLFEYQCRDCNKQFTFLSGVVSDNQEAQCPRCKSANLSKLMSRFVRGRSDDARMESMADRMEENNLDDPDTLRRFAREIGREISAESGEDLTAEMEELIESDARGEAVSGSPSNSDDGTIY
jgi:putative FmdB family regulatory protein